MSALSLFRTPPPEVAVEIGPRRVSAVAVASDPGGTLRVLAHASETVAAGAVTPALNAPNITDPAEVTRAVARVFAALGRSPRRVVLVVPDAVSKVSFVKFASPPERPSDLDEMIRFQVRKAAPFRVEDAAIAYLPGLAGADGHEYVVTQARTDIVAEYERACADAGAHAGTVALSTFGVVNATLAGAQTPAGDWLVIHAQDDAATLAILRAGHLVFFRHRGSDADGQLGDLVHQTAMYYQDRLAGPGFARVLATGSVLDAPGIRQDLERRLGAPLAPVDVARTVQFADRLAPARSLLDVLIPALGHALADRS